MFSIRTIAFPLVLAGLSPLVLAQAPLAPSADLEPPEVVASMLSALKKNSDEGIAELYSFSSPENRERTGPLASFEQLIRQGKALGAITTEAPEDLMVQAAIAVMDAGDRWLATRWGGFTEDDVEPTARLMIGMFRRLGDEG